jgi:hypothetical protein
MTYGPPLQHMKLPTHQAILKLSLRTCKLHKPTQMPTLRTAATASSTRTDQVPPVTLVTTPVRTYTPTDELARSALYAVRKDVGPQGILKKSVTSLRRDLTTGSISLS